jgi:hypothetical protein
MTLRIKELFSREAVLPDQISGLGFSVGKIYKRFEMDEKL